MTAKETHNLLKSLGSPSFACHTGFYWTKAAKRVVAKKIDILWRTNFYRSLFLPQYIRREMKKDIPLHFTKGYLENVERNDMNVNSENANETTPITISLANTELCCNDVPDWLQRFDDHENTFALHRWGWLLLLASERPSIGIKNWGIRVMNDWCNKMNSMKGHPAWESYSVSERIVNALLFLYVLRNHSPCETDNSLRRLEENLIAMASYLVSHLEYHGELTNNHILNNARALYILGRFAASEKLVHIGRKILVEETPRMITPSGFLREDSTSYHFLLLRTYLEILWAAECTNDMPFANKIRGVTESMLKAAWIFNIYNEVNKEWTIPLIGDVSPDYPVNWLNNICRSPMALKVYRPLECETDESGGWNGLWNLNGTTAAHNSSIHSKRPSHQMYDDSGWYRVDCGDVTILWHVNFSGSAPLYSHGHNDIGSFVFYWKGYPIIIDPGRFNYMAGALGLYGKTARAHNTLTLDGYEPYPLARSMYPPRYRRGNPYVQWKEKKDGFYFKIVHDGFQRISRKLRVTQREFHVSYDTIRISDYIHGSGSHNVKTYFHFGSDIDVKRSSQSNQIDINASPGGETVNFTLQFNGILPGIKLLSGVENNEPIGWNFPEYGKALPTTTCLFDVYSRIPYSAEYLLKCTG